VATQGLSQIPQQLSQRVAESGV